MIRNLSVSRSRESVSAPQIQWPIIALTASLIIAAFYLRNSVKSIHFFLSQLIVCVDRVVPRIIEYRKYLLKEWHENI